VYVVCMCVCEGETVRSRESVRESVCVFRVCVCDVCVCEREQQLDELKA